MKTTYTPVNRPLPPRFGIVVADGVGRRTFWYSRRRRRDAEMEIVRRRAAAEIAG